VLVAGLSAVISLASCKKSSFIDYNTNPTTLYTITPEQQFTDGAIAMFDADFEYYYDYYRIMMPWMQYHTPQNGNSKTFMSDVGNFNQRRGYFYSRVGNVLTDVQKLIEALPEAEQAKRVHQKAIAQILKTYYAFYTTDINGSIAYAEAFQARYGGTVTPKFETQQQLFDIFDKELKDNIALLKSTPVAGQTNYGNADLYYQGNAQKWVKAANALRLRIAMRLMKRDAAKLKTIATEVLATASDLFQDESDNLMFITSANHAGANSNWDPAPGIFRATKSLVDFMWETGDPRIRIFFQKNSYTQENFDLAKAQGKIGAAAVWNPRQYVGSFANPDSAASPQKVQFYTTRTIVKNNANTVLDTLSRIQYRLFSPAVTDPSNATVGTGQITFPMLTYAELCFYRAELAARNITTEVAADWYEKGVKSSLKYYSTMGDKAKIFSFTAITDGEINTYYNTTKVKYDPAKALEQITAQSFIHFFKQANEGWSLYKRTGMPNSATILPLETILADGVEQKVPRRALLSVPLETDRNFANAKAAIDEMAKDPDFGAGPADIQGRVWWDKK
jgi:hypothetical protein